jgi:nucleoid-associated protein YgaU
VVKPGESLWEIAAAELGATAGDRAAGDGAAGDGAVAKRWPQWYAANRAVIGPDPDLILPGQALRIPAAPATDQPVPPTHQEK